MNALTNKFVVAERQRPDPMQMYHAFSNRAAMENRDVASAILDNQDLADATFGEAKKLHRMRPQFVGGWQARPQPHAPSWNTIRTPMESATASSRFPNLYKSLVLRMKIIQLPRGFPNERHHVANIKQTLGNGVAEHRCVRVQVESDST